MEIKKSPKADLQNKRGLLLEIGLAVALAIVIGAFAWTPNEHRIEQVDLNYAIVEEEITEITRQDQKPPEPPKKVEVKVIADLLQVVTNDTKIETSMTFDEFDEDAEVFQEVEVVEEEIVDDEPFLIVETMPTFQGGDLNTFRNWVQSNVRFPQIALENGIQGNVVIQFVVGPDGKMTNFKVLQSPDKTLSDATIDVLKKANEMKNGWKPGKQRGKPVKVSFTLPVAFKIQN